jgi:flagellar capping protein FliD
MPIQAETVDVLVERSKFEHSVAVGVAQAIDMAIAGANLVTVPILDARCAKIEKSIANAKLWAIYLYAALTVTFFGALAADHHWLVNREDQLIAQVQTRADQRIDAVQARSDQRIDSVQARSDQRFESLQTRMDARFQQVDARFQQVDARFQQMQAQQDKILDQLRTLSVSVASIQATLAKRPREQSPPSHD